ncbi:hypothetical protein D3C81_2114500 [compost metagenome]
MSILHRGVEFLLQLASHQLDYFEVTQVVVEVVEQDVQQHILRCVQGVPLPQATQLAIVRRDDQQA